MKSTFAAAAALVGSVSAAHGHGHAAFHGLDRRVVPSSNGTCGCTTIYTTYHGKPTTIWPSAPVPTSTYTPATVPTPIVHSCPTTGVYTFPAEIVTLTETATVCVPTTTPVSKGTHTYGGVTTVVTTATTVTCPYPTVETSGTDTTYVVKTTTYVCPSAGTYTIVPTTTAVEQDTTITVPALTTYCPGTYTAPAVITTVTDTKTVVVCPFDVPTSATPAPTYPAAAAVPSPPAAEYPVAPAPSAPVAPAPPATYPVAPPAETQPSSDYTPAPPTGGLGGNVPGKPWAITFTPYLPSGQGCMTREQVDSSIKALAAAGIKTVRTYSTDCDTLPNIGDACRKYGVKMIVGIFVDSPGCQATRSGAPSVGKQMDDLAKWAQWDLVPLAVIGNEGIINGFCNAGQIANLIQQAKSKWPGYKGPYTTAETVNVWQQDGAKAALCGVVDVVGANAWAFFDLKTSAENAGKFVKSQLDIISKVCPGKKGYVLETGWPSAGNAMGAAVPGYAQQAAAIKSIVAEVGESVVVLSPFNDKWKDGATACACEQHFGCKDVLGISGLPTM